MWIPPSKRFNHLVKQRTYTSSPVNSKTNFRRNSPCPSTLCGDAYAGSEGRNTRNGGRGCVVQIVRLLSSVSVSDLRAGKRSHQSRNAHIARVLKELGYMREIGEGMLRIFATMRERDLVPPEIKSNSVGFELVLHHRSVFSPKDQEWLNAYAPYALSRDEQRVVLLGRDGSQLSTNQIIKAIGIADVDEFRKLVERL